MPNDARTFFAPIALSSLLVLTQAGCIALNIPSQRYHDPADHGGMLGPWSGAAGDPVHPTLAPEGCGLAAPGTCHACETCETCEDPAWGDPCEDEWGCGMHGDAKPPEIPWPRFHPVPTRPVFGSPSER